MFRAILVLAIVTFTAPIVSAQTDAFTRESDREVLRLIRNGKLDLILPGAMRDNNVDMWIHVARTGGIFAHASGDPMAQHFGAINGYLIFTDLGDRIERAVFGDAGAVENIDLHGLSRCWAGFEWL